jgi:hypothetical protein
MAKKIKKVIRDGKVAVAVSPGFGAGWTTWNNGAALSPFEPKVIEMIEAGRQSEITESWCEKELGLADLYCGGAEDLKIEWLPVGTRFQIHEYDGSESIITTDDLPYIA